MSKKIISNLFNYAASENAKGFVIESNPEKVSLNYHFHDGEERSFNLPKKLEKTLSLTLRQILKLSPDELIRKKYCKIEEANYKLSFNLTVIPSKEGEKIIISIIPKNNKFLRLKQLGMSRENLKTVKKALNSYKGLILISSSHGHGRKTTMYSLLQELNCGDHVAYFIGSQTEHELKNILNIENTQNNWTKILNTDSEIIATEINTKKDFKNATLAAASGRLVIASIVANSSWEVLLNYLKLNLPFKLKIDSLKLIINQRIDSLKRTKIEKLKVKKNKRQEIGLFEVLEIDQDIKNFLIETEKDKVKKNFWQLLGKIAIKNGYEPISSDDSKKRKNGLL